MKKFKGIISVMIALCIAAGTPALSAAPEAERVGVIVEVKGDAVLEAENAVRMGFKLFSYTDEAERLEVQIRTRQTEVESDIKSKIDPKADIGFTYTHVFNGFSANVSRSDIDRIKKLKNVENVYISRVYDAPEPLTEPRETVSLGNGTAAIGSGYMLSEGITGAGSVIAIIDDGFDTSHEMFKGSVSNPKLTKTDIADTIKNGELSVSALGASLTANRVYKSEKIPFAFNYDNKDSDTYDSTSSHGTHIAGIAAGNNGSIAGAGKFIGAAPDAQLLLLACPLLDEAAIIAAADDAAKLGADVINASYGADYMEIDEPTEKTVNTAVNAGVIFAGASGNIARGYKGRTPNAENIDYGASGFPALFSAATSVASCTTSASMSNFSSWGVGSSLELKPEIAAPGSGIYSSVNDDEYRALSGTSMAAPHLGGAAALMTQYITDNPEKYGETEGIERSRLIENLLMTGAQVLYENKISKIPYSPRFQGAGMINLENSVKTPVVLTGEAYGEYGYEKSKISLGEIGKSFTVKFKAKNLTASDVMYDSVKMTVITDSADADGSVSYMKNLTFTSDLPESVTVPAKDETEIMVNVSLDENETEENLKIFTNGFYIDGYVFLGTSADTIPEISIPFMGFYGDWSSAPSLDSAAGENPAAEGAKIVAHSRRKTDGTFGEDMEQKDLGANIFIDADSEDAPQCTSEKYAGISPNGDGEYDTLIEIFTPLRQLGETDFEICGADGKVIASKTDGGDVPYLAPKFTPSYLYFDYDDVISKLAEGDYTFRVKTGFLKQKEYSKNESHDFGFYVDRTPPSVKNFQLDTDGRLSMDITDNYYIMGIIVTGRKNGEDYTQVYPVKADKTYSAELDVSDIDEGTLCVEVLDYAQNSYKITDKGLDISYYGRSQGYGSTSHIFNVSNTSQTVIKAYMAAAIYRDGSLVGLSGRNEEISAGNSVKAFDLPTVDYDVMKIFVWDAINNMLPLYNTFDF